MCAMQPDTANAARGRLPAKRRKHRIVRSLFWTGATFLLLLSLALGWEILVLIGVFPVPDCLPGDLLYPRVVAKLTQAGVIPSDERLLFFVSGSPFSMRSGSLCTDRRAIAYDMQGNWLQVWSATYHEIADLHWQLGWIGIPEFSNANSTITVTKKDGSWFTLGVYSDPTTGRCRFKEVLQEQWESARQQTPPAPATAISQD